VGPLGPEPGVDLVEGIHRRAELRTREQLPRTTIHI